MISTLALREKSMQLLAADPTTLAPAADANTMVLVQNLISPSENTIVADLTLADFDGSTPIDVGLGAQPEGLDSANNDSIIDLKPPATGFRWETTGTTNLPQTIYGYALMNDDQTVLFACELLTTPVVLTAINQRVDIGAPNLRQRAGCIS